MQVTFGLELDSPSWPSALGGREASLGHLVAGPARLLENLELRLGLAAPPQPETLRVALYAERLAAANDGRRFYHRSLERDRWGTARALLGWRDELVAGGWKPDLAVDLPRIRELAEVERVATPILPPGEADRLRTVLASLPGARLDIETVRLVDPREDLPPAWQRIVRLLEGAGAHVSSPPPPAPPADPSTDLERLQHALLVPGSPPARLAGDGTLLHLRGSDPWKAAEALASLVAAHPAEPEDVVVVRGGAADVLDEALRGRGLPPLGSSRRSPWRPATQVLPLLFTLAWRPLDPFSLLELLTLGDTPVPPLAASALAGALREAPGVDGDAWKKAWADAVEATGLRARREALEGGADDADAEVRAKVAIRRLEGRLEQLFGGGRLGAHEPSEGIPIEVARELAQDVASWAREALEAGGPDDPTLHAAEAQASEIVRILDLWSPPRVSRAVVEQIVEHVRGAGVAVSGTAGEVGPMHAVDAPGSMHGPAPTVIWWHFVAPPDAVPRRAPWTHSERQALSEAGVDLPRPEEAILGAARRWRRPILMAERRLILVSASGGRGESLRLHPLHDEIRSRACPSSADEARITRTVEQALRGDLLPGMRAPAVERIPVRTPAAVPTRWAVPRLPPPVRDAESSNSLECLLGCPLRWILRYAASVASGSLAGLAEGRSLAGTLAHAVVGDVLVPGEALPTADEARRRISEALERRMAQQAAPLLLPSRVVERAQVAATILRGALALVEALRDAGVSVVGTEVEREVPFEEGVLRGYIDLLVRRADGSPAIVDLKFSGLRYRREQLEAGTAVQLATYARLVRDAGAGAPAVAYFLLREAQMLTLDPDVFPTAVAVDGPGVDATWERAMATRESLRTELGQGIVRLAGSEGADDRAFRLDAPCDFCEYALLCGRMEGQ